MQKTILRSELTRGNAGRLLYDAAESGNTIRAKLILKQYKYDDCYVVYNDNTALHIAFINKHYEIVDLILESMHVSSLCYSMMPNLIGLTHFHIACTRKNEHVIEGMLKESRSNIRYIVKENSPQWAGYDALHFAASFQSLPAIKLLLKAGMNPDWKTSAGETASDLIRQSLVEPLIMLDLLENKKENVMPKRNLSNFQIACLNEDKNLVQKFIDHEAAKLNSATSHELSIASLSSPLHCAVASNCKEKVELLLQNGAKVECGNHAGMTPLHLALYEQSIIYKKPGGYITQKYDTKIADLLYAAIENKMINHKDTHGLSFFHAAIAMNDLPTVKQYLTESKVDVNKPISSTAPRFSSYTPLHMAIHYDRLEIAKLLIEHNADVNASDKDHGTAIQMAFSFSRYEFVDFLMRNKDVKLDVVTPRGQKTMLHLVVQLINSAFHIKDKKLVPDKQFISSFTGQLVRLGIDVNAKDERGDTALHYFRSQSPHWVSFFQLLLNIGADINLKNNEGKLPFDSTVWELKNLKNNLNAIFYHHVQKLKTLGLDVDSENEEACKRILESDNCLKSQALKRREQQRLDEIAILKCIMISDVTSLYTFVKLNPERAKIYVESSELKRIAGMAGLRKRFPSYGYLIQLNYRAATGFCSNTSKDAKKRIQSDDDEDFPHKRQRLE